MSRMNLLPSTPPSPICLSNIISIKVNTILIIGCSITFIITNNYCLSVFCILYASNVVIFFIFPLNANFCAGSWNHLFL